MKLAVLCLFCCLLCSYRVSAKSPNWHVKPTTCISALPEVSCVFTLFIALENMTAEQYCLSLDSRNLGCYSITEFPLELTVKLEQSEQLTLLDTKQTTLLTTTLFIKSQRQKQRRRLRSPWSIF